MRKLLITSLIGLSLIGGCSSQNLGPNATTQQLMDAQTRDLMKTISVSRLTTGAYLVSLSKDDRAKTVKTIREITPLVDTLLNKDGITPEEVRTYVVKLLSGYDVKNRDSLNLLLDAITTLVDEDVKIALPTSTDSQTVLTIKFIKASVEGVNQGVATYGN